MKKTPLDQNWTVKPASRLHPYPRNQTQTIPEIPAKVPGSVHLDLLSSGFIAHPFKERYEGGLQWVDETDWTYRCRFDWKADSNRPNRYLRFNGLDTVAEIFLNAHKIAAHDNFFVPLEVDVTNFLKEGSNELEIRFRSAVNVGDERRSIYFAANGIDPNVHHFDERAFVRKPGYMSGWDWGPRLVSCGIWRPVELLEFAARIRSFSVHQKFLRDGTFQLSADYDIQGSEIPSLSYNGKKLDSGTRSWEVSDPLWWPHGEGSQPLQEVTLTLPSGDQQTKRIGLRTIELVREQDKFGTSFEFLVNGRRLWSRGANWIPHNSFPGAITDREYSDAISRYASLGMNMLRIWGGGLYETDEFYDACDREGILVWQDFPFACSYHPDDEPNREIAAWEASFQVNRLKDRTCLAIWCGNNENRAMWFGKWAGAEKNPARFYGEHIYDVTLKQVVSELDPDRAYIESSPLLVPGMPGVENPTLNSDDHYWDVWHGRGDWEFYSDSTARFSSEFGFASSCSRTVWNSVSNRQLDVTDPAVRWHDKTNKPWATFLGMVTKHYPQPETLDDWIYYSQLNQRDAMRAALEHYRGGEFCRGALIWQVNDCWPVQSWALEDFQRLLKPAGHELSRLYAPTLLCTKIQEGNLHVILANDSGLDLEDALDLEAFDSSSGVSLLSKRLGFKVDAQSRTNLISLPIGDFDPRSTILRCRVASGTVSERWVFLAEPKDIVTEPVELTAHRKGDVLTVRGNGLVLDLIIWNEDDPHALRDLDTGLAGFKAVSAVDPELQFKVLGPIKSLRGRSLSGTHGLSIST